VNDHDDDWKRDKWLVPPDLKRKLHLTAAELRQSHTASEKILWQALRNQKLNGGKFRRQVPVGGFIVDFYCASERLVIEIDGPIHNSQQESDTLRQEVIETLGIRFIRFTAIQVEQNLDQVLNEIRATLT
jgi:very-short-patch-repair endonuclease